MGRVNVGTAEALISAGRMRPPGLAEIEAAGADGRWAAAYQSQRTAEVPPDLPAALAEQPGAAEVFARLGRSERYAVILPLLKARTPAGRAGTVARDVRRLAGRVARADGPGCAPPAVGGDGYVSRMDAATALDVHLWVGDSAPVAQVGVISDALDEFNVHASGIDDRRDLAVVVEDAQSRRVVGGLTGRTSLGLLFVDLFHLPERLRGSGLGSEILRLAEDEGRRRGCRTSVLYTISFQAPAFYERNGWRVFGEVPCDPPGTSRVFMTKDLAAP